MFLIKGNIFSKRLNCITKSQLCEIHHFNNGSFEKYCWKTFDVIGMSWPIMSVMTDCNSWKYRALESKCKQEKVSITVEGEDGQGL